MGVFTPLLAAAQAEAPKIDTGDTAWVLVSTALVLLMTPGLAFFYAGMVRAKNVTTTLFQNFFAVATLGVLWMVIGYSLSFSGNVGGIIGDLGFAFLNGVGQTPNADFAATIPHALFMLFQCMFAVITPILISGAVAERVTFKGWALFTILWSLVVYAPVAHWVWGLNGWIRTMGALDFAGGMVVHMTAGYSALVLAALVGKRNPQGLDKAKAYDLGYITLGTGLLVFGWFGFNGGSALGSNGIAVQAFGTTFFAAAAAMLAWTVVDTFTRGKPSLAGAGIGAVAGLVCITPGAGFVTFGSALIYGLAAGVICNLACQMIKKSGRIDDTLDVFACHGVGGTLGTILTALFATKTVNPAATDGLFYGGGELLKSHLIGSLGVIAISVVGTTVLYYVVSALTKFRAEQRDEVEGLDSSLHDEMANSMLEGHTATHGTRKSA